MRHFFVNNPINEDGYVFLSQEDSNHLLRVLRWPLGKELSVSINEKQYLGIFEKEENSLAKISIVKEIVGERKTAELVLCQGVAKGQKMESILIHGTEVGVDHFIPMQMDHCVSDLRKKYSSKKQRYEKIVLEAAKQSNRLEVPTVNELYTVDQLLEELQEKDGIVLCYENEEDLGLESLELENFERVFLIIGPEGGISNRELELLEEKKAKIVSLGNRILRTETAAIVASYTLKRMIERQTIESI